MNAKSITFPGLEGKYKIPQTAEDVGARPDTWTPTAEDVGAATPEYVKKANPVNLLDNSDFRNPVNQRGLTVYQQDSGYAIDRWKMKWSGEGELKVNDGYITLYRPIHSAYVFQNIPLEKKLIGKTVTVAAKVRGYGSLSYNFNGAYMDEYFSLTDWKVIAYSFTVPNYNYEATDVYGVGLITQLDKHLDCEWIALYEGEYTAETLPEYHPKGYAHELAECKRYFEKINWFSMIQALESYYIPCTTWVEKRIVPTITVGNVCNIYSTIFTPQLLDMSASTNSVRYMHFDTDMGHDITLMDVEISADL